MKRTCPPPADWHAIHVGDRIRYQNEAMPVEVEDTVVGRSCGMLVTEGGQEVLPNHYILHVASNRGSSLPSCSACGGTPSFERRPRRAGYAERLACPHCGHATPWLYAGPNGEHRPDLLRRWQQSGRPQLVPQ